MPYPHPLLWPQVPVVWHQLAALKRIAVSSRRQNTKATPVLLTEHNGGVL